MRKRCQLINVDVDVDVEAQKQNPVSFSDGITLNFNFPILYFQLPIIHSVCPPNFAQNIVVKFSWEVSIFPRAFHNNSLCQIWGANRVHYGQVANRKCSCYQTVYFPDICLFVLPQMFNEIVPFIQPR